MPYEKHQRDYTVIGTSVVFHAYGGKRVAEYFGCSSSPLFILVDEGILYHYVAEEDAKSRVDAWMARYGTAAALALHKAQHDEVLREYRAFLSALEVDLPRLHEFFDALLPLILVAIEVPEHAGDRIDEETLQMCLQIRKENEDVYKIGFDAQMGMLRMIAIERGVDFPLLTLLTANELHRYQGTGELPQNLSARETFVLISHDGDEEQVFETREVLERFHLEEEKVDGTVTEFKGQPAFKGIVRGKVRVVHFVEEAAALQEGEILVTAMTDPRYVPVMKRAAAIITNEGGVTCHAAIVARELEKPCIIGTKIATKVLKDGDVVEVDATNGVVRKISTENVSETH